VNESASDGRPGGLVRARQVVNLVNLATPLGLAVAVLNHCRLSRGPHGLILARGGHAPFPRLAARLPKLTASAITVGDVVMIRISDERLARRTHLLDHEARHALQYAVLLGPVPFFLGYGLASAWSWCRAGNPALHNVFERRAGLLDGGYAQVPDGLPDVDWPRRSGWAAGERYRRRISRGSRRPGRP
jgi:hypothetical protein